jgi:hypothetical protein
MVCCVRLLAEGLPRLPNTSNALSQCSRLDKSCPRLCGGQLASRHTAASDVTSPVLLYYSYTNRSTAAAAQLCHAGCLASRETQRYAWMDLLYRCTNPVTCYMVMHLSDMCSSEPSERCANCYSQWLSHSVAELRQSSLRLAGPCHGMIPAPPVQNQPGANSVGCATHEHMCSNEVAAATATSCNLIQDKQC